MSQRCHSDPWNDVSIRPPLSSHSNNDCSTMTKAPNLATQTTGPTPAAGDAGNQPTSGSDRHQSAMDPISLSMTAHIRAGQHHPPTATCSKFNLKAGLPSICTLGARSARLDCDFPGLFGVREDFVLQLQNCDLFSQNKLYWNWIFNSNIKLRTLFLILRLLHLKYLQQQDTFTYTTIDSS